MASLQGIHIHRPDSRITRQILYCPTCDRRRRFVIHHYIWYSPRAECVACGDSWGEEGRYPRPFARGWRVRAIKSARQDWANAVTQTEYRAWLKDELDYIQSDEAG